MVAVASQLHGPGSGWPGVIHTPRLRDIGFAGPGELEKEEGIPGNVVSLLNEPINAPSGQGHFTKF